MGTDVTEVAEARPLRADARRNRDALLVAAAAQFADRGVESPVEDIARSAGVGIGTLYRHFPTRDALIADVYRREVDLLCGGVDELLATLPADEALEEWMRRFVGYVATKRGLAVALKSMVNDNSGLFAQSRAHIYESMARLVHAAVEAGLVRADADPEDVAQAMSGFCIFNEQAGWQEQAQTACEHLGGRSAFQSGQFHQTLRLPTAVSDQAGRRRWPYADGRSPVFCSTVRRIGVWLGEAGCDLLDGSISGAPPSSDSTPTRSMFCS